MAGWCGWRPWPRVTSSRSSPLVLEPADIELGAPYPVALALWRDGLDPNVAFMQGRLKMNGGAGLWLRLLPELHRPEHVEAMARLAAETDFPA